MQQEPDNTEHHQRRSEFIRHLVQRPTEDHVLDDRFRQQIPKTIVQFWHDLGQLPPDVGECVRSWTVWESSGFEHKLFDRDTARAFIGDTLGARHKRAYGRCYHPAMQADYFRLCYILLEGGFYVDADDVCVSTDISWLAEDGRLKLQPLCYDVGSQSMVQPSVFLEKDAYDPNWIFYFNNNPLVASKGHPIVEQALSQATRLLEMAGEDELPEIQAATGPGNISKAIFDLGSKIGDGIHKYLVVLGNWEALATSKWPLSYRADNRNWRLSNQKKF